MSGGRAEGHLGPSSGGDHKGKVKAVTKESADERRPSKPLPPSTDWPGKAKSKAQANMADYILLVKGKGKEKAISTKDGVLEKGRQRQESIADNREEEPDLPKEEPRGQSCHHEPKGGQGARSKSRAQSRRCVTMETAQTMEEGEQIANDPCARCSGKFTCIVGRNAACKMCNFHKVGCTFVNWDMPW